MIRHFFHSNGIQRWNKNEKKIKKNTKKRKMKKIKGYKSNSRIIFSYQMMQTSKGLALKTHG